VAEVTYGGDEVKNTMLIGAAACFAMFTAVSMGADTDLKDERERADNAAQVLVEIARAEDAGIPNALLDRAKAIAVTPHVVRGAFGVGGRFGKGLVTQRLPSGEWSAPAFVNVGGASFGFQIGGDATDLILVFIEEKGLEELLNDKLTLGADASVAAGPLGRSLEAGTNVTLDSAIYSYSRSKGLFAGVALDGTVWTLDDDANRNVYGPSVTGKAILDKASSSAPVAVKPFGNAVKRLTPKVAR